MNVKFNHEDLTFLAEWIDSHQDDLFESIRQLKIYHDLLKEDEKLKDLFLPTFGYLAIAKDALEKASLDLGEVNFNLFKTISDGEQKDGK